MGGKARDVVASCWEVRVGSSPVLSGCHLAEEALVDGRPWNGFACRRKAPWDRGVQHLEELGRGLRWDLAIGTQLVRR